MTSLPGKELLYQDDMADSKTSHILIDPLISNKPASLYSTFEVLLVASGCTLFVWYLQHLWSRRKLYECSKNLPGPFAFPLIGSAMIFVGRPSDIFDSICNLFNTYPGIFRVWFGTRLFYAISDPKYFEIVFTSQNALSKEALYRMAEPVTGHGLFTAPVKKWKKHRKIILPTFNQKILEEFVEVFVEQSDVLVEELRKYSNKGEFDLFHVISNCTLDIICETAMGVKVQAQTTNSNFALWADRAMEIVIMRIFNIVYHNDTIFNMLPIGREMKQVQTNMRDFTGKVVTERRNAYEEKRKMLLESPEAEIEEEPRRKAFLDLLIEVSQKEDTPFTHVELIDEVVTFMVAGTDTTASTNCFIFTMLGLHQNVQRVYEEILDILGPDRKVEPSDMPKFKYMERVIKESLRLFPVGAFIVRACDEDIDIGDYMLPKGCSVVFGILRAHTNEKYWPDPYRFDPDRFLPENSAKRSPCAFVPFSFGPRNCIGIKYAMMAMKSLLATVLRKYRISTSYKCVEDIKLKTNLVLRPKDGFKVSIQPRE